MFSGTQISHTSLPLNRKKSMKIYLMVPPPIMNQLPKTNNGWLQLVGGNYFLFFWDREYIFFEHIQCWLHAFIHLCQFKHLRQNDENLDNKFSFQNCFSSWVDCGIKVMDDDREPNSPLLLKPLHWCFR